MGADSHRRTDDTHDDIEGSDYRQRGRGRREQYEKDARVESGGRGTRYRPPVEVDDLPDSDFEMMHDDMPPARGRGRRDSRHDGDSRRGRFQDNRSTEEWSEVDLELQNRELQSRGRQSRDGHGRNDHGRDQFRGDDRTSRGSRGQRYEERADGRQRPARNEEPSAEHDHEPLESFDSTVVSFHGDVPSWDEAIGDIISSNLARHGEVRNRDTRSKNKEHTGRGARKR
jgi:hypothetical protein